MGQAGQGCPGRLDPGAAGHPRAGHLHQAEATSPHSRGSCLLNTERGCEQVNLALLPESPLGFYIILYIYNCVFVVAMGMSTIAKPGD